MSATLATRPTIKFNPRECGPAAILCGGLYKGAAKHLCLQLHQYYNEYYDWPTLERYAVGCLELYNRRLRQDAPLGSARNGTQLARLATEIQDFRARKQQLPEPLRLNIILSTDAVGAGAFTDLSSVLMDRGLCASLNVYAAACSRDDWHAALTSLVPPAPEPPLHHRELHKLVPPATDHGHVSTALQTAFSYAGDAEERLIRLYLHLPIHRLRVYLTSASLHYSKGPFLRAAIRLLESSGALLNERGLIPEETLSVLSIEAAEPEMQGPRRWALIEILRAFGGYALQAALAELDLNRPRDRYLYGALRETVGADPQPLPSGLARPTVFTSGKASGLSPSARPNAGAPPAGLIRWDLAQRQATSSAVPAPDYDYRPATTNRWRLDP